MCEDEAFFCKILLILSATTTPIKTAPYSTTRLVQDQVDLKS